MVDGVSHGCGEVSGCGDVGDVPEDGGHSEDGRDLLLAGAGGGRRLAGLVGGDKSGNVGVPGVDTVVEDEGGLFGRVIGGIVHGELYHG